jgi:hypothetical protein
LSYDYNKNVYAKKKYADLTLVNNYQEEFEENFKRITALIDLYFENEEQFKSQLKVKNTKLENMPEVVEGVTKKLQDEKQVQEEEKNELKQIETSTHSKN